MLTKQINMEQTFDPYDFLKETRNGVDIYWKNISTSPCIHLHVCFGTGALDDPEGEAGVSHFLEHMIFDGSPLLPTKKDIEEWGKIYTLKSLNAWTWLSQTNYHLHCLPEHFDTVITGIKDMIFHPLLRLEDIEHERNVITQEAWGSYKNEKYLSYVKSMVDNAYHNTARATVASSLGWPDTVAKISQENVKDWHQQNYGKGNFYIVISGNIDHYHIEKLDDLINEAPVAKNEKKDFGNICEPKNTLVKKTGDEIGDPREQVEISFDRVMDVLDGSEREINTMTRSLLQDLLFERLRTERALCYGVSVEYQRQKNFISWGVNIKADEENAEIITTEFWKALDDITSGREQKRFDTLKQVLIDRLKSAEEVTAEITDNTLHNIWRYGKISTRQERLLDRQKIVYSDITDCLSKAFDKKWTVTEIILPTKK